MANSPADSLEAYFHDLLTERQEGDARIGDQPFAAAQPKPVQPEISKTAELTAPAELPLAKQEEQSQTELQILEEFKRQKLQEMLSQQALPQVKTVEQKTVTKTQVKPQVATEVKQEQKVQPKEAVKTTAKLQTQQVNRLVEVAETHVETTTDLATQRSGVLSLLEWAENGRPIWAQGDFDALFFQVSGLTLAVPLVALGQIVRLDSKPTPIAGQSEWFMGVKHTSLGDIRTVNTALFVMPERYNPDFVNTAQFIISIDGLRWGLAVDNVNQPVRLNPADVSWRSERSKRPWLAGTVKAKMCALLDIPQMAHLLNQSDRNLRR